MNSEELFIESQKYLPGGVSSPVRAFKPYPFFVKKANGSKIEDVDGNQYIDYCLAYGPLILGHAPKNILPSIIEQMEMGTAYGAPTELEIELAKEVISRVPCAEMIRFVNSGGEATMSAIRLARGYTGKKKIIKFEGAYHGAHDYTLVKTGTDAQAIPDSLGIPEETTSNTYSVPFNDKESLTKLIEKNSDDIACLILEPIMGNIGCVEPKEGFLKFLRDITSEYNIVLIFDEVITGFRLAKGGAQEYYNVTPDLVTMGKILGGGFPMGAFAGKKEIMSNIAPEGKVYQAGTFNGNPVSIKAGYETLKLLDDGFYKDMSKKGDFLRNSLKDTVTDIKDYDLTVVGLSSMFQVYFNKSPILNYVDAKNSDSDRFLSYFNELKKNGVFVAPSQFECGFISIEHSTEDLEKTSEIMDSSLKIVCK